MLLKGLGFRVQKPPFFKMVCVELHSIFKLDCFLHSISNVFFFELVFACYRLRRVSIRVTIRFVTCSQKHLPV